MKIAPFISFFAPEWWKKQTEHHPDGRPRSYPLPAAGHFPIMTVTEKDERLTDCCLTELLVRHLAGDVGPHEDADVDLQFLSDDV